jgi:hypothetical protein
MMQTALLDILVEALYDTLSLFPYLFLTYLLMEYLEHTMSRRSRIYIRKAKAYGPFVGGVLGILPQCGFSVVGANLYATGLITLGTMMAVFLSTSDEMLPLLISGGVGSKIIFQILSFKFLYAVVAGILIDAYLPQKIIKNKNDVDIEAFCQRENCKCENKENMFLSAFKHTERISILIFVFSFVINTLFLFWQKESIIETLSTLPIVNKFIAAAIGLIPSCYPSVFLTQLYLEHAIGLGTLIAGTLSNAGLGFLVLYRVNADKDATARIMFLLYAIGVVCGIITEIIT